MSDATQMPCADDVMSAIEQWQLWLRHEKRSAAHTASSYLFDLHNLLHFVNGHRGGVVSIKMLSELTLGDFRSWLAHNAQQEHSAASRARAVAGVRNFFRWLDRTGQMHNPAIDQVKMPKIGRRLPRPVTEAEAHDIVTEAQNLPDENWIGLRDEALFTVLYGAGLRISEALSIRASDLAIAGRLTVTGKGNKQRIVPILPVVIASIEKYRSVCPYALKPDDPIFVGARGEALNPAVAQRHLRQLRRRLNLPDTVTPHALRHSFASHMLAAGADLRSLQELLGHSSLSTTQLYTQVDGQQLARTYRATHPRAKTTI